MQNIDAAANAMVFFNNFLAGSPYNNLEHLRLALKVAAGGGTKEAAFITDRFVTDLPELLSTGGENAGKWFASAVSGYSEQRDQMPSIVLRPENNFDGYGVLIQFVYQPLDEVYLFRSFKLWMSPQSKQAAEPVSNAVLENDQDLQRLIDPNGQPYTSEQLRDYLRVISSGPIFDDIRNLVRDACRKEIFTGTGSFAESLEADFWASFQWSVQLLDINNIGLVGTSSSFKDARTLAVRQLVFRFTMPLKQVFEKVFITEVELTSTDNNSVAPLVATELTVQGNTIMSWLAPDEAAPTPDNHAHRLVTAIESIPAKNDVDVVATGETKQWEHALQLIRTGTIAGKELKARLLLAVPPHVFAREAAYMEKAIKTLEADTERLTGKKLEELGWEIRSLNPYQGTPWVPTDIRISAIKHPLLKLDVKLTMSCNVAGYSVELPDEVVDQSDTNALFVVNNLTNVKQIKRFMDQLIANGNIFLHEMIETMIQKYTLRDKMVLRLGVVGDWMDESEKSTGKVVITGYLGGANVFHFEADVALK